MSSQHAWFLHIPSLLASQVTVDGQRVRLQQLEVEVKKPKEDIKKQAEEPLLTDADKMLFVWQ